MLSMMNADQISKYDQQAVRNEMSPHSALVEAKLQNRGVSGALPPHGKVSKGYGQAQQSAYDPNRPASAQVTKARPIVSDHFCNVIRHGEEASQEKGTTDFEIQREQKMKRERTKQREIGYR